MSYRPSDTAQKIIALLENAKVLAIGHQKRTMAFDVVKACKIYAFGKRFPISHNHFDHLASACLDKMNGSLLEVFNDIEEEVIQIDISVQSVRS